MPVLSTLNVGVVPVVSKSTLNAPVEATFGMSTVIAAVNEPVTPPVVLPGAVASSQEAARDRDRDQARAAGADRDLGVRDVQARRVRVLGEDEVAAERDARERDRHAGAGDGELAVAAISSVVSKPLSVNVSLTSRVGRVDLEAERALQRHAGDVLQRDRALDAAGDAAAEDQPVAAAVGQRQQVLLAVAEREVDVGQRELDRRAAGSS